MSDEREEKATYSFEAKMAIVKKNEELFNVLTISGSGLDRAEKENIAALLEKLSLNKEDFFIAKSRGDIRITLQTAEQMANFVNLLLDPTQQLLSATTSMFRPAHQCLLLFKIDSIMDQIMKHDFKLQNHQGQNLKFTHGEKRVPGEIAEIVKILDGIKKENITSNEVQTAYTKIQSILNDKLVKPPVIFGMQLRAPLSAEREALYRSILNKVVSSLKLHQRLPKEENKESYFSMNKSS